MGSEDHNTMSQQPQNGSPPPSTPVARGKGRVASNLTLAVALQNLGSSSVSSQQRRARLAVRSSPPIPQQQQPVKAPAPLRTTPHPNNPIQTKHQWKMLHASQSWGRLGLSKAIYEEARAWAAATDHSSWVLLAEDEEKDQHVYHLLNMLPDPSSFSLIRNTIAFDYHNDSEVRRFVTSDMMPKEMQPMAGIYIKIVRRSMIGLVPNSKNQQAGKWLSSIQIRSLIDKVKICVANKQDPNSVASNNAIVSALGRFNPSTTVSGRQFTLPPDSTSTHRVNEWLQILEDQYCTNISQSDADIPFQRCPTEVGWAQDINSRLKAHVNNNSTTPLFGSVKAISSQSIADGGAAFPSPMQSILCPIWKDNTTFKTLVKFCVRSLLFLLDLRGSRLRLGWGIN